MLYFYFFLLFFFWGGASVISQELAPDQERYLKYKPQEIRNLANELGSQPGKLVQNLKEKLNEFYLSDPSQKKIQALRKSEQSLYSFREDDQESNANARRLFLKQVTKQKVKGFLIKEAMPLYLMHKLMAQNLLKLVNPQIYQSEFHFRQALRYRSLKLAPDILTNEKRLELLDADDPEIQLADQYRTTKEALEKTQQELKEMEERNIILDDSLYFSPQKDVIRSEIQLNQRSIANKRSDLEELEETFAALEEEYQKREESWNKESADFLVEFAELQKKIEDNLKNRQKVINKQSFYKTSFNQTVDYDYTKNRDFRAYAELLELAGRLDKENPAIPLKLGREYKNSRENAKAETFFEQALQLSERAEDQTKLTAEELKEVLVSLGGIAYQSKRFVDSAKYYEQALSREADSNLLYLLGSLHYNKTGHYQRAIDLLERYLEKLDEEENEKGFLGVVDRSKQRRQRFFAVSYIAGSLQKLREYKAMLDAFDQLRKLHLEFIQEMRAQREKVEGLFRRLEEARRTILDQTNQAALNQFYLAEREYRESEKELVQLKATQNSLPLRGLYFNLAEYWETQNNIKQAIMVYEEAERYGVQPNEARRRYLKLRERL